MDEDQAVDVRYYDTPQPLRKLPVYLRLTLSAENEISRHSHLHWPRGA